MKAITSTQPIMPSTSNKNMSITDISRKYHLNFNDSPYVDIIVEIYNEKYNPDIASITDINILRIYGNYHKTITKCEKKIVEIYSRLIELNDESAYYILANYYSFNDDDESAIDILNSAINKFNNKKGKYMLAKCYLNDEMYLLDGLELLQELADTNYLPAIIDLTIHLYQMGDMVETMKYVLKPYIIENTPFDAYSSDRMCYIARIMWKLYEKDKICEFLSAFPNNIYACNELKKCII